MEKKIIFKDNYQKSTSVFLDIDVEEEKRA